MTAPVDCVPLVASLPDQPPEAVHDVALLEDQVSVEVAPLATLVGFALIDTVGAGEETDTVADCEADPPLPVQVMVYLVVAVSAAVVVEPLVASVPLQPPEAVQLVALLEDQLRVELPPLATVLGLALILTVGAGGVPVTELDGSWAADELPSPPQAESKANPTQTAIGRVTRDPGLCRSSRPGTRVPAKKLYVVNCTDCASSRWRALDGIRVSQTTCAQQ